MISNIAAKTWKNEWCKYGVEVLVHAVSQRPAFIPWENLTITLPTTRY